MRDSKAVPRTVHVHVVSSDILNVFWLSAIVRGGKTEQQMDIRFLTASELFSFSRDVFRE